MAKTDNIRVRIEPEVKAKAVDLFDSCGLDISSAITLFIHQSLKTGGLPFEVLESPKGSKRNAKQVL